MRAAIDGEIIEPTTTLALVQKNPALAFGGSVQLAGLYDELEQKVRDFKHDLSTGAGRQKTTALVSEIVRTKTSLDAAGKELNAGKRKEIDAVDEARREIREKLDELRDRARKPLTDWEEAEAERQAKRDSAMAELRTAAIIDPDETVQDLLARIEKLEAMPIERDLFRDAFDEASSRRDQAVTALRNGILRIEQAERDRAELAKLRAEAAEREQKAEAERLEREAREAEERRLQAEKEAAEREAAEKVAREQREKEEAEAREKAELERIARAEEAARKEAEERAERERVAQEERHAAELRRLQEEADERERVRLAEIKAEGERQRKEREAEERRQQNVRHRTKVIAETAAALADAAEIDLDTAKRVVSAIAAGNVPNASIQF